MKVINLIPRAVTVLGSEGELIMEVQSSGNARAKQESSPIGLLDNIPLFETYYGLLLIYQIRKRVQSL